MHWKFLMQTDIQLDNINAQLITKLDNQIHVIFSSMFFVSFILIKFIFLPFLLLIKQQKKNSTVPPEIEVERSYIHTGVGYEAQLICIVHAEPAPHVVWYKDGTQLGTTEQHSQQVER